MNIFTFSATPYGPEDKFTGHLAYLFENLPELGQSWLDHLRTRAGLETDRFLSAGKHAEGSSADMPDFLVQGTSENLICEHKLGARLGPNQLERYLEFAKKRPRPTRLAFVTGSISDVSSAVLNDSNYLRPSDGKLRYFRWEELYPIVAACPERLAREFTTYMEELGLRPSNTREWSDLFTNSERVADFAPQWNDVISHFRRLGAGIIHYRSKAPAVLIRDARPWLAQLYLKPVPRVIPPAEQLAGPYICALAAVSSEPEHTRVVQTLTAQIETERMLVLSRPIVSRTSEGDWHREYVASLDDVASAEPEVMRRRLLDFALTVFEDLTAIAEDRGH